MGLLINKANIKTKIINLGHQIQIFISYYFMYFYDERIIDHMPMLPWNFHRGLLGSEFEK